MSTEAKPLLPLPLNGKPAADAVDTGAELDAFVTDFDAVLSSETSAAKARPVAEFPGGEKPEASADLTGADADEQAQLAAVTEAAAEQTAPAASAQATTDAAPVAEKPAPETKPEAVVEQKPEAKAEPAAPTYDPKETIALNAETAYTREQLVGMLTTGSHAYAEAVAFRNIFRCDAAQAQAVWAPIVEKIVADPGRGDFVDAMLTVYDNPAKRAYVEQCASFFDEQTGAPAQPQRPERAVPDERDARIARLEAAEKAREHEAMVARVQSEQRQLVARYPQLADQRLWQTLTAYVMASADPTYTLTRAADDFKDVIERWAPQPQATVPAPQPAPARESIPALNGAKGAQPNGPAPRVDTRPKRYASPDDALDDWEANVAPALGYRS